jgi:hypothetical protein
MVWVWSALELGRHGCSALANLGWVAGWVASLGKAKENSQIKLVKLSSLNQCAIGEKYKIRRWRATMALWV